MAKRDGNGRRFVPRRRRRGRRFLVRARYGKMLAVGDFVSPFNRGLRPGGFCVVKTSRGTEFATVLTVPRELSPDEEPETAGRVIRVAVDEDIRRRRYIEYRLEPEELAVCRRMVKEHGLPMRVVAAEHVLGGEKIIFYFLAEHRVDFRALVRRLAEEFHTRIELRQIGVRDEARILSDWGHCGQPLCCRAFLRHLEPVGMKEAKLQQISDPTKMSGRCGRLMCCLKFEVDTYRQLLEEMPAKGARVLYMGRQWQVADRHPMVNRLTLSDGEGNRVTVPAEEVSPVPADTGGSSGR